MRDRRAFLALAAGAFVLCSQPAIPPAVACDLVPGIGGLAPPFDSWNVTVDPGEDPQALELAFDSPLLGVRAVSHVYLPDAYYDCGNPLPVSYFLHGTIRVHLAPGASDVFDELAANGVSPGYPVSPGNGRSPTRFVRHSLDRANFVVVTPDSGPVAWCDHCFFVDGYGDAPPAAESHLYEELIPLVEAVFRVRDDRSGRGIFGRSMGGGAALIQGFRHPDRFAFVGALSPSHVDWIEEVFLSNVLWKFYLSAHGYPHPLVSEIPLRNLNPFDLAPNVIGTNQDIVMILGDGCVDHSEGFCQGSNLADDPGAYFFGAGQEIPLRRNADLYMPRLTQLGVPIAYVQREGLHGQVNQDGYERFLLPRMNKVFSEGTPSPHRFSYKTADQSFSVWGYDFEVERSNEEFLSILGGRVDGRELVLAGTGAVTVTTPAVFAPRSSHTVRLTPLNPIPPLGRAASDSVVIADGDGRLEIILDLAPQRSIDERKELVTLGTFSFPQTRIEVVD